ncbi:transposase [Spirosoma migulaei]
MSGLIEGTAPAAVFCQTGFTQQPYIPYGWQKKHQPLQLPARTTTKRLNLLGLMRLDNHLTVYHSEKPLTGTFVVESLTHFVNQPHAKPVVIVLDNGWSATAAYPSLSTGLRPTSRVGGQRRLSVLSSCLQSPSQSHRSLLADDEVALADESELPVVERLEKGHICHY